MKILHVIDSGGLYGAEIMLLTLIHEQIRSGLTPVIASIGTQCIDKKPLETEAERRGIKVKKFRMNPGIDLKGVKNLLAYAHHENFDLIHSHGYKGNLLLGFLPLFMRKLPIVSTIHGYVSTSLFSKIKVYELLDEMSHLWIEKVVLVNKKMLNKLKFTKLIRVDYEIVNNGVSLKQDNLATDNDCIRFSFKKFCEKGFIIGSIGRLSVEKGFLYLIESFQILVKKGIDARLIIIGDGPERSFLEAQVEQLGLSQRVLFTGYMDNAKEYIHYFNLYVISSLTEGLPITLLEAMNAKVPVVATRVGGIPEVIVHETDGLIVSPENIEELSEAILRIHNNPDLADKFVKNSYHRVIHHYSAFKMADEYNKLYKKLIYYRKSYR